MVRAVRLHGHDTPLQVEDVGLPAPDEGEVRVDLAFAGVNPVDSYVAQGRVAADGPLPRTVGGEASGHLAGRPVLVSGAGLGSTRDGVWAGAANVPASAVVPLPEGIELREAAALGVAGLTAWHTLHLAAVEPGDRVLVLGASGGVGLTTVSLAVAMGATVWGQTGSGDKADAIRRQGAHGVVVTDASGLAEALVHFEPTVVVDGLGAGFTSAAVSAMAPHGRLVLFGTSAGSTSTMELRPLYRKGLTIFGYGGLILSDAERRSGLIEAMAALAEGRMRIPIDRTLPLEQVNDALRLLADRAVTGKIVLDLAADPGRRPGIRPGTGGSPR
jgi:NADPH2:quinone reductase